MSVAIPAGVELWVDGKRFLDGSSGDHKAPMALDGLTVRWGRSTTVDQPEPAACSVDILDRGSGTTRVDTAVKLGSRLVVWATLGSDRRVVFAGRVTDVEIAYDDAAGGAVASIIATDLLGDLANRFVGSEPWVQETLYTRAARIIAAVAAGTPLTVDTRPGALPVSRMDVDRQPAANLLRDLATSGTGVLWVVVPPSGTPALRIEDPAARSGLWVFDQGTDGLWRPVQGTSGGTGGQLDACAILRDPVRWNRATADLVTRVTVRWQDPSTSPDPTERSVGIVDATAETTWGARGLSVGTILVSSADATAAANLLMAAHSNTGLWRASGLVWDLDRSVADDATTRAMAIGLLDNSTRIGAPVLVGVMPGWTPGTDDAIGLYVDGGTYTFTDGRWILSLTTTPSTGSGASMTYVQSPRAARYQDVATDVSYLDLVGVGPPGGMPIITTRTNQALSPRAVSGRGWLTTRGFQSGGTGAGTYTFANSPTPPPLFTPSPQTVLRKSWTTASTNPGNVGFAVQNTATDYFPVTPGQTIAVAGYMRRIGGSAVKTFVCRLAFYNQVAASGATQVGSNMSGSGVPAPNVNEWLLVGHTVTVPAGAAGVLVYLDTASNSDPGFAVGDGLDATGLIIEQADAVTTYFDGSFAATADTVYAWTGTVNQSASTATTTTPGAELTGTVQPAKATASADPRGHNNAYGFPVPDPTDPYYRTPAALTSLRTAIEPKLTNPAIQFIPGAQYSTDANGEVLVDLSSRYTAIAGAIVTDEGPSNWDAKYYQMVTKAGDAAGRLRIRALTLRPPDGTVVASNVVRFAILVWGTPK